MSVYHDLAGEGRHEAIDIPHLLFYEIEAQADQHRQLLASGPFIELIICSVDLKTQ